MKHSRRKIYRSFFGVIFSLLCLCSLLCGIDIARENTERRFQGGESSKVTAENINLFFDGIKKQLY